MQIIAILPSYLLNVIPFVIHTLPTHQDEVLIFVVTLYHTVQSL